MTALTEAERSLLGTSLRVAAHQYEQDVADVRTTQPANSRLIAQFQRQAVDARLLAERIEQAEEINVKGAES